MVRIFILLTCQLSSFHSQIQCNLDQNQFKKMIMGSSCCGTTGSVVSLQRQEAGLIPGPAQWVKRIWCCHSCSGVDCNCASDLIPGLATPYAMRRPKKKKKKCDYRIHME